MLVLAFWNCIWKDEGYQMSWCHHKLSYVWIIWFIHFGLCFFMLALSKFSFFLDILITPNMRIESKCVVFHFSRYLFLKKTNDLCLPQFLVGNHGHLKFLSNCICCIRFQCPIACVSPNYGVEEFCFRFFHL
jgi:hypothetical protein